METLKDSENLENGHKKGRHRKKQLYNSILHQMEFYFSDANLAKDRFLAQLIQENPHVDVDVFLKFNKIRKLTTNVDDIRKALKNSTLIELSEEKDKIRRKQPVKEKTNANECTIYVERLKTDVTHEWLSTVFAEFGNVVYVSIPKYRHNGAVKGFAFIEYDTKQEAHNALNYFESIGCKMPSNTEPDKLCSIATFEQHEEPPEKVSKKRKLEEQDDGEDNKKKPKAEGDVSESDETEHKKKKKLKKEHKRKNFIKELGLQVLSKIEWKKMRNRYLELQRKKMKEFKRHLHKAKFSAGNYEEKPKKTVENNDQKKVCEEIQSEIEFVEGVIVKIDLPEPCSDTKKLKTEVKSGSNDVKYVDIPNPACLNVYVRFSGSESAQNFATQKTFGVKTVLSGDEEKLYWEKLTQNRDEKFKKGKRKQRGRDKLLKKANKIMAMHTKFDE